MPEIPIACTLPPDAYRARTDELGALARPALRTREPTACGERLVFTDTPGVERRLRDVIAAESRCCPFLRMELTRTPRGLVLEIAGAEDARPVIAQLFASAS